MKCTSTGDVHKDKGELVTPTRKLILGAGALLLPLSSVFMISSGQVWAKKGASPGTVTCASITGSVKYSPPLTAAGGASSETVTTKTTLTQCTVSGTGAKVPSKGTTSTKTTDTSNGCVAVLEAPGKAGTLTTKWSPGSIEASVVSGPAPTTTVNPPGHGTITLTYGGAGTTGSGSFPGSDNFASSTASITLGQTEDQITASCSSSKGLKGLTIVSGHAHVG